MEKLKMMLFTLQVKAKNLITDEKGEVNIVTIVVLIGIAVLLALVFKDQIKKLLETLFASITKTATEAVEGGPTPAP